MIIQPPTECPSCGSTLELVNSQLFCRAGSKCPAQNASVVQNYCKKLKIKGVGPATIEKLGIASIEDLYNVSEDTLINTMGERMAEKLYSELKRSTTQNLSAFIAAVNIPLIGDTAGRKLGQVISTPSEISPSTCNAASLGAKATSHLLAWVTNEWVGKLDSLPINFIEQEQPVTGQVETRGTVCITGKLNDFKNRAEAAEFLASIGYVNKTSVTRVVSYLICEDPTKVGSSSYKKAEALGIPILSIEELIQK